MKLDLSQLTIVFPEKSTKVWAKKEGDQWGDYRVTGRINNWYLGRITVSIWVKSKKPDDFWHNREHIPPLPRPVVVYHKTHPWVRGHGVAGKILVLANEIAKARFGESLGSDTLFCSNPVHNYVNRGFHPNPARRVWEKLEQEGKAYRKDFYYDRGQKFHPRWIMF